MKKLKMKKLDKETYSIIDREIADSLFLLYAVEKEFYDKGKKNKDLENAIKVLQNLGKSMECEE